MFFTADMYNNPNNCIYCRYKEYYVDSKEIVNQPNDLAKFFVFSRISA